MARAVLVLAALSIVLGASDALAIGSVKARVSGDKLTITGDDAPNSIQVIPGSGPDAFVVVGLEATLVNGTLTAAVSGVKAMSIDMKGGADHVELTDVVLDKTLIVTLGAGSDSFVMQGGRVTKKTDISGGADADDIRVRGGARVGGQLLIKGGKKVDTIVVTDASIGGDSEIKGGSGNDNITVQFTALDDGANLVVGGGDGTDNVMLIDDRLRDVQLYMGNGDDDLRIQDCDFEEDFHAEGNGGHDRIDFDGNNVFIVGKQRRVKGFEDVD
jgi:hypothetical protein